VVLVRHPDHTGGPARSTSVSSISDLAPPARKYNTFSCAVVRPGAWLTGGEVKNRAWFEQKIIGDQA
jgi:hypothetical protein